MECGTCMAWSRMENQPEWGECHRHAPSPRTGPDSSAIYGPFNLRGIWPYTRSMDFCHEHLEPETEAEDDPEDMMEDMMEMVPPTAVDQALTPDKFSPDTSFGSVIEQARRIAYGG